MDRKQVMRKYAASDGSTTRVIVGSEIEVTFNGMPSFDEMHEARVAARQTSRHEDVARWVFTPEQWVHVMGLPDMNYAELRFHDVSVVASTDESITFPDYQSARAEITKKQPRIMGIPVEIRT